MNLIENRAIILGALIGSFLYLLSSIMPLIGGIISFFSPIPLGYIGFTDNKTKLLLCLFFTCAIIFFAAGRISVILYLIQYGAPFYLFFEFYNRGIEVGKSIFITALVMILMLMILASFYVGFNFSQVTEYLTKFLDANFQEVLKSYKKFGISENEISQIASNLKVFGRTLVKVLPSLMVMFYTSIFLINLPIAEKLAKIKIKNFDFKYYKYPFFFVWVFIIAGFGIFFLHKSFIWWVLLNILIICSFVFLIQGFSVIECWFEKINFSKFMKNLLYILILFSQFLLISIAVIGLFDNWFDFRKIINRGGTNENNT